MDDEVERRARKILERREASSTARRELAQRVEVERASAEQAAEQVLNRIVEILAYQSQKRVAFRSISHLEAESKGLLLHDDDDWIHDILDDEYLDEDELHKKQLASAGSHKLATPYAVFIHTVRNGEYGSEDIAAFIALTPTHFCANFAECQQAKWRRASYTDVEHISREIASAAIERMAEVIASGGSIQNPENAFERSRIEEENRNREQSRHELFISVAQLSGFIVFLFVVAALQNEGLREEILQFLRGVGF